MQRCELERNGVDFTNHVRLTHNLMKYLDYYFRLEKIGTKDLFAMEQYIWECIQNTNFDWIPFETTWELNCEEEDEEDEMDEVLQKMDKLNKNQGELTAKQREMTSEIVKTQQSGELLQKQVNELRKEQKDVGYYHFFLISL